MTNEHYTIEHYFLIKNVKHDKNFNKIEEECDKVSHNYGENYFIEVDVSQGVNKKYFHFDIIEEVIRTMGIK